MRFVARLSRACHQTGLRRMLVPRLGVVAGWPSGADASGDRVLNRRTSWRWEGALPRELGSSLVGVTLARHVADTPLRLVRPLSRQRVSAAWSSGLADFANRKRQGDGRVPCEISV